MPNDSEQTTRNVGRPIKIQTLEELQTRISGYFSACDPHVEEMLDLRTDSKGNGQSYYKKVITEQVPYTITDLATALDVSRDTLLKYQEGDFSNSEMSEEDKAEFVDTIKRAKQKCEGFAERQLFGPHATGPIFNLKNNYGWKDQSEVINSNVDADLAALDDPVADRLDVAEQANKALAEQDANGQPEQATTE